MVSGGVEAHPESESETETEPRQEGRAFGVHSQASSVSNKSQKKYPTADQFVGRKNLDKITT